MKRLRWGSTPNPPVNLNPCSTFLILFYFIQFINKIVTISSKYEWKCMLIGPNRSQHLGRSLEIFLNEKFDHNFRVIGHNFRVWQKSGSKHARFPGLWDPIRVLAEFQPLLHCQMELIFRFILAIWWTIWNNFINNVITAKSRNIWLGTLTTVTRLGWNSVTFTISKSGLSGKIRDRWW